MPFAGLSRREIESAKRAGRPPGPIPPDCPEPFQQLIAACLHNNPASRPRFDVVRDVLQSLVHSSVLFYFFEKKCIYFFQKNKIVLIDFAFCMNLSRVFDVFKG